MVRYTGLIGAFAACAVMLTGCLEQFVPANTKLHDHTLTAHIPGMSGDDRIVYTRCYSRADNGAIGRIDCYASLSNGVSDLINDLHTGVDILDFIGPDVEPVIKSLVLDECVDGLEDAMDAAIDDIPGIFGAIATSYVDNQVRTRIDDWCEEAIDRAWVETDDNTYSTGHKCATGKVGIEMFSVNLPPDVTFSTYPIHEDNQLLCPRARVVFNLPWPIPDLRWGND